MDRFVWRLAGQLGLDPGPFTLRELVIMAEAASEQRWTHTSAVLALLANLHRDPKKTRAFKPADFNPHLRRRDPPIAKVGVGVLKQVFVDRLQTSGSRLQGMQPGARVPEV